MALEDVLHGGHFERNLLVLVKHFAVLGPFCHPVHVSRRAAGPFAVQWELIDAKLIDGSCIDVDEVDMNGVLRPPCRKSSHFFPIRQSKRLNMNNNRSLLDCSSWGLWD